MTTIQNQESPKENFHFIKDFISKFAQIEVSEGVYSSITLELFDIEYANQLSQADAHSEEEIASLSISRFEFTSDENGIWSESNQPMADEYSSFFKQDAIRVVSCTFTGRTPYYGW